MAMSSSVPQVRSVDQYIKAQPKEMQTILSVVRKLVLSTAPEAEEKLAYGMPAYKLNGKPLIYFAGYKTHLGLYATPATHDIFAKELSKYVHGKGSVQFPFSEPIPFNLIKRMVEFKQKELSSHE